MAGVCRPGPGALAQLLTRGCLVNQTLFNLVAAAATAELLHAMSETVSARGKVKRLDAYIRNVPYKDWVPVSVNTRLGVVAFAGTGFVVLFGASYLVVSLRPPRGDRSLLRPRGCAPHLSRIAHRVRQVSFRDRSGHPAVQKAVAAPTPPGSPGCMPTWLTVRRRPCPGGV